MNLVIMDPSKRHQGGDTASQEFYHFIWCFIITYWLCFLMAFILAILTTRLMQPCGGVNEVKTGWTNLWPSIMCMQAACTVSGKVRNQQIEHLST